MAVENVTRVGAYPIGASPYGALDMAGNVEEWVADWYGSYPSSSSSNPTGPDSGTYRVLRGGTWYDAAVKVRASERRRDYPGLHAAYTGFRCAR
jgi:eukaryotic-like serine/threonine-protein kinase